MAPGNSAYRLPRHLEGTTLDRIMRVKLLEIEMMKRKLPASSLSRVLDRSPQCRSLKRRILRTDPAIIAEIKRASPSAGVIREDFDPVRFAAEYEKSGAAALSVITEVHHFQGGLEILANLRWGAGIPLLRKDFIVDEYQLLESRHAGADAVLLIAALLSRSELKTLHERAHELGMETLVEVHEEAELEAALEAGATLLGVNNRDLRSFEVSLDVSLRLIEKIPATIVGVAESGIRGAEDLRRLRDAGFKGFLIGEHFMRSASPGAALSGMLAEAGRRRVS